MATNFTVAAPLCGFGHGCNANALRGLVASVVFHQEIAASPEAIVPAEVMTTSLGSARRPGTESKVKLGKSIVYG